MEISVIVDLLNTVGFPIGMAIALFWKMNMDADRYDTQLENLRKTIENNTKVISYIMGVSQDEL